MTDRKYLQRLQRRALDVVDHPSQQLAERLVATGKGPSRRE